MINLAVITSGFLPVPATKGGAVENLIQNLLNENENVNDLIHFVVFSTYEKSAEECSKKYKNTEFIFFKPLKIVKFLDLFTFFIARNIFRKKNSQSYRYIFQRLWYLNKCSQYLRKNDYDKVLLENHPTQFLSLKWRKNYLKYKDRYYYHCHNEFVGSYGCDNIIKNTKNFICVSNYIANSVKCYTGVCNHKISVLRNCVDENVFSRKLSDDEKNKLRQKYNIKPTDKVILFTGRLVPEKGVKELLRALREVKSKNYKLLILGKSLNDLDTKTKFEEELESVLTTELNNNVVFTGFIDYKDIYKFYSLADFSVLPSIWNDPAPLTIIESLVSGVPIISTNSGGIPEYATEKSAILLERDDLLEQNIAKNIDVLLSDSKKLNLMSESALKVSSELSRKSFYDNFCNLIF